MAFLPARRISRQSPEGDDDTGHDADGDDDDQRDGDRTGHDSDHDHGGVDGDELERANVKY